MKTYSKTWTSIGIILFGALYSFVLFTLKKDLSLSEWIVYGFTILAFLILIVFVCVRLGDTKEYAVFDIPQFGLTLVYFGVQFIFGGILAMIFPLPDEYRTLLIETVVLAAFIIISILFQSKLKTVRHLDDIDYHDVSHIREMTAMANTIAKMLKDPELILKASQMADAFRYTDPVHISETKGIEERIENNLKILREDIETDEMDHVAARIDKILLMIEERAGIIAYLKK